MASVSTSTYDKPIKVCKGSAQAEPWQAVQLSLGNYAIRLSCEEAAQLAVDLLNAAEAKPVDVEVAA